MATQISGINGNVSMDGAEVENILNWSITVESDVQKANHSDSSGWEEGVPGVKRWSGEFTIQADQGKLLSALWTAFNTGASMAFIGTAFTAVTYSGTIYLTGPAGVGADIQNGTVEEHTWAFEGSGALTPTTT
jgi:hypothetical protein